MFGPLGSLAVPRERDAAPSRTAASTRWSRPRLRERYARVHTTSV